MKPKITVALLLLILFVDIAAAYAMQRPLLSNVLYLIPPFISIIAGLYAIQIFHWSNSTGKVFALLTAGLTCLFIGEVLFFAYQFIFHIDPFPSVADVFYLAAYPLLFAAFVKAAFNQRVKWSNFSRIYLLFIVLLLLSLAALVAYFGVYLAYKPDDSAIANTISIAYGIGDLIIIVPSLFILKIILDFRGGKLFNSWVFMLAALMCLLTGDLLFAIYHTQYTALEFPYTMIDIAFVGCYLLFAYSFYYTGSTIKEMSLRFKK
jgi:hypothetical protein